MKFFEILEECAEKSKKDGKNRYIIFVESSKKFKQESYYHILLTQPEENHVKTDAQGKCYSFDRGAYRETKLKDFQE